MKIFNSVCVFSGSSFGENPNFKKSAFQTGKYLAENGIKLIYGGSSIGLMGVLAGSCLEYGGYVVGIIPQKIYDMVDHLELNEYHIVNSMHERKAMMYELGDCFVALPGGIGTIEELFEAFTWTQLGYITKPVGLLNVDNYYGTLLSFLDEMQEAGFIKEPHRNNLHVAITIDEIIDSFQTKRFNYINKV
jgi:uncharacterized protein (TIGR00730 family)